MRDTLVRGGSLLMLSFQVPSQQTINLFLSCLAPPTEFKPISDIYVDIPPFNRKKAFTLVMIPRDMHPYQT